MSGTKDRVRSEIDRLEEKRIRHRNGAIALIIALLPIFGGGGVYAATLISESAQFRLEAEQAKVKVESNHKGIIKNRLLILRLGQDISVQIAEAHGRPVQLLPTVEAELNKALAEMAGR